MSNRSTQTETFDNVLETSLASSRPGESVEVINAGSGGYSLYNYPRRTAC